MAFNTVLGRAGRPSLIGLGLEAKDFPACANKSANHDACLSRKEMRPTRTSLLFVKFFLLCFFSF